uniref:NADP-dependent oxidoreductase domain-containing protein n=1 Tax=Spumella elongata TaxID=89044 RepID=A0A7S3HA81_9STRA
MMVKSHRLILVPIAIFFFFALLGSAFLFAATSRPNLRSAAKLRSNTALTRQAIRNTQTMISMPRFMYGTAWKKDRTKDLVELAVRTGFRGIDTACQPKHYFEPGVGEALQALYTEGVVTREDIFLQTKFTSLNGQDPNNIPYDKNANLSQQVHESFVVSCQNLRTPYVNSLVLHGPMPRFADTMQIWRAMEEIHSTGGALQLGISNTYDIKTLRQLYTEASVKPTVLQNRFYADSGYDTEIRAFCKEHSIAYQSFWTLTANPHILKSGAMKQLTKKYSMTSEQVFFMFVQALGITPLTGSSSELHMKQDLDTLSVTMDAADVELLNGMLG